MADTSINPQLERLIQQMAQNQASAAKNIAELSKKLSDDESLKYVKTFSEFLKNLKLINEESVDQIKTMKSLEEVVGELEKQHEAVYKILEEEGELRKKLIKDQGYSAKAAKDIAEQLTRQKLEELKISESLVDALKDGVPKFRKFQDEITATFQPIQRWRTAVISAGEAIKDMGERYAKVGFALEMMKKGLVGIYAELHDNAQKGLLGATVVIGQMAGELHITTKQFGEMVDANRDIVKQLGGGTVGIRNFKAAVEDAGKGLEYLGTGQAAAAAKMVQLSKNMGLTSKDGAMYQANIAATTKQFAKFNRMFGDNADTYSDLFNQLNAEEQNRSQLNSLDKVQALQQAEEIRKRAEMLKIFGLTNQQVVEFNQKISSLIDPNKNDIEKHMSEAVYARMSVQQGMSMLAGSNNTEDQKVLADVEKNQAGIMKMIDLYGAKKKDELNAFKGTDEGIAAVRALAQLNMTMERDRHGVMGGGGANSIARNYLLEGTGNFMPTINSAGAGLVTARANGDDLSGPENAKRRAEIEKNSEVTQKALVNLGGQTTDLGKMFSELSKIIGSLNSIFENPLAQFAAGLLLLLGPMGYLGASAISAGTALARIGKLGSLPGTPNFPGGPPGSEKGPKGGKGGFKGKLGGFARLAGYGFAAYEAIDTIMDAKTQKDAGEISDREFNKATGGAVGGATGALAGGEAGAAAGAAIGSFFFGAGAVPGAIIGGLIGGAAGYYGGNTLGQSIGGSFGSTDKTGGSRSVSGTITNLPTPATSSSSGKLLDFIGKYEAGGSYNRRYGDKTDKVNLEDMTIAQIYDLQKQMVADQKAKRALGGKNISLSSAVGKYQVISDTLHRAVAALGLDPNTTKFDKKTQDLIGQFIVNDAVKGASTPEEAAYLLSKVFGALPKDASGVGVNDGFNGNKASAPYADLVSLIPFTGGQYTPVQTGQADTPDVVQQVSGTAPTTPLSPSSGANPKTDTIISELKKQTDALSTIVKNTAKNGRQSASDSSYQAPPAVVMNGS